MNVTPHVAGLSKLTDRYDCILCDVWGVLHNGKAIWMDTANALVRAREAGQTVVMITNAPRPQGPVLKQLANMNCPDGVFDDLVTSGDVTRALITQIDGAVYHIGPERDYAIYEGLDVSFAEPDEAKGIVCTGLFDDYNEHPEEYIERFKEYISNDLPFICANPDIIVEVVDKMLWCAQKNYQARSLINHASLRLAMACQQTSRVVPTTISIRYLLQMAYMPQITRKMARLMMKSCKRFLKTIMRNRLIGLKSSFGR